MSLDDYISSYSKSYNDLLQTGVPHDSEAELSQFLAGLDTKRHNIEGLAALELQDLTSFGIPSPYTLENVISHLRSSGRRIQSHMIHGHPDIVESVRAPDTV